jgi:hypothetical protein
MDKDHVIKYSLTYEIKFAIGSREGYHGRSFTKKEVLDAISEYQETSPVAMPVKVTGGITFVNKDYREGGFEISGICYPNSKNTPEQIEQFMFGLAEYLLYRLNQNRITVRRLCTRDLGGLNTRMLERTNAEKTHKK